MKYQCLFSGKNKKIISKCHLKFLLNKLIIKGNGYIFKGSNSVKIVLSPFLKEVYSKRNEFMCIQLGPVVQSVVSLTSSLRVILLTVLADSIHNILIFFAEKM